jgi:hypothetical protein
MQSDSCLMTLSISISPSDALRLELRDRSLIAVEFMYRPRPTDLRRRRVFDFALDSRLRELNASDGAACLLLCDSAATAASFAHLPAAYPRLPLYAALINPLPDFSGGDMPSRCGWAHPEGWRRYALTDRWARILFAFDVCADLPDGWLIMPAHDAVWGAGLLDALMTLSRQNAHNGQLAAVSPYTPHHHSPVPGADIPTEMIDALNAAFARDPDLRGRIESGRHQAFWGKMGMLPFGMIAGVRGAVKTFVWEDDLEIDRAIRALDFGVRCLWVDDPALYRQALPVFDRADLRAVLLRTLHYSLPIPGAYPGAHSALNLPSDGASPLADALIAECNAEIAARIAQCGASWVDWGAYRYVAQIGDPAVQVWKYEQRML